MKKDCILQLSFNLSIFHYNHFLPFRHFSVILLTSCNHQMHIQCTRGFLKCHFSKLDTRFVCVLEIFKQEVVFTQFTSLLFLLGKITKQTSRCKRGPTGRKWYSNEHRSPGVAEEIAERTAGVVGQVAKVIMQQKLLWGIDRNRRSCKLHTASGVEERSHFKLTYRLDQGGSDPTAVTLAWSHFSRHLCERNYGVYTPTISTKSNLCVVFFLISARYLYLSKCVICFYRFI